MKKRLVTAVLVMSMSLSFVACGNSENSPVTDGKTTAGSKPNTEKVEKVENEESASEYVMLYEFMKNITPTYSTNKQDVSGYYYVNEKLTLDKGLPELNNVSYKVSTLSEDYSARISNEYDDWNYASKIYTGIDSNLNLIAGETTVKLEVNSYRNEEFENDWNVMYGGQYYTADYYATVNELNDNGVYTYYFNNINGSCNISDVINIEKGKSIDELNNLVELWGQPSIASYNYGSSASLVWCFDDVSVDVWVNDFSQYKAEDSKDLDIMYVNISYCTYDQMYEEMRPESGGLYKDETPVKEEKEREVAGERARIEETKAMSSITGNMPESVILTYNDKEIDLLNTGYADLNSMATSVFDHPGTRIDGGLYDSLNEVDISIIPSNLTSYSLHIKGSDGNLTKYMRCKFNRALNALDVSIMGISKTSTFKDVYNVFGYAEVDDSSNGTLVSYEKVIGGQECTISVYFDYDLYLDDFFVEEIYVSFD